MKTKTKNGESCPWNAAAQVAGASVSLPAFTSDELAGLSELRLAEHNLQEILLRSILKARVFGEVGHETSRSYFIRSKTGIAEQFMNFVSALASSIDAKDPYTHGHSKRVTGYALAIAEAMGLEDDVLEDLELAGYLHDIGKIGMPQDILQKPFGLTGDEYAIVKKHPTNGVRILENLKNLQRVSSFILHHHERVDGEGYPSGLGGDYIPLGAKILAVADAYDAITSDRPYRKGICREDALQEMEANAGKQFDPKIIHVFSKLVRSGELESEKRLMRRPSLQKV